MIKTVYRYKILCNKGVTSRLAKRFNVSPQTIRAALRFSTSSELSNLIRQTALKEYSCALVEMRPTTLKTNK